MPDEARGGVAMAVRYQPFAPPTGVPMVEAATPPLRVADEGEPTAGKSWRDRLSARREHQNADLLPARPPLAGAHVLRLAVSALLAVLAVLTLGAGLVLLLLWQEDGASGVLSNQIERAWDLTDNLRRIELIVAVAVVPLAAAWAALATLNVRRATARRCNPVIAALSIPAAAGGVWAIGASVVEPAEDWATTTGGLILQAVVIAVPMLVLERVAMAAEGPRRPLRATYVAAVAYIVHLQTLGALSTIEATDDHERWGRLAAYLIMAALIQLVGAIAANEACRSIEDASEHRYSLRKAFGESVLLQADR